MQKQLIKAMGLASLMMPLGVYALDVTVNGVTKTVNTVSIQQSSAGVVITTDPSIEFSNGGGGGGSVNPVAINDSATTPVDTLVNINVAGNDTDPNDAVVPASVVIVTQPAHGTAVAVGDGTVDYTPSAGYIGNDSFTYNIKDGGNNVSNNATVNIAVGDGTVLPVANNDTATTDESVAIMVDVLANDTDTNNDIDETSVVIVSDVSHGTTSVNATTGVVTYTPTAGYVGSDSFTYKVSDDAAHESNVATVTLTVNSVSACGALPAGVNLGPQIDWAAPGGRSEIHITGTETYSQPFTSTSGGGYGGQIAFSETSGYESVMRKLWISTCPGGPAVPKCEREGVSAQTLRWGQLTGYKYCELDKNTDYYLNMTNTSNCAANRACGAYRSILTNNKPY